MGSSKKGVLLIVLLIAIALILTGCETVFIQNVRYLYTVPHDNQFHPNEEIVLFQKVEGPDKGKHEIFRVNLKVPNWADNNILEQVQSLTPGNTYKIIYSSNNYLVSISSLPPPPDK